MLIEEPFDPESGDIPITPYVNLIRLTALPHTVFEKPVELGFEV